MVHNPHPHPHLLQAEEEKAEAVEVALRLLFLEALVVQKEVLPGLDGHSQSKVKLLHPPLEQLLRLQQPIQSIYTLHSGQYIYMDFDLNNHMDYIYLGHMYNYYLLEYNKFR